MKTLKLIENYINQLNEQDATMPDPNAAPALTAPDATAPQPPAETKNLTSQGEIVLLKLLKKSLLLDVDDNTKTLVDKIGDITPENAAEAKDMLTKIIGMEDIDQMEEPSMAIQ